MPGCRARRASRVRLRVEAQSQGTVLTDILDPPPCTATRPVRPWQARSALGSAQRSTHLVTITAAMAAALAILTEALDEPGTDIAHSLHRLTLDAAAAIPSYLGLSVVVSHSDPPFTVTTLADGAVAGDICTSLHLRLPGIGGRPRTSLAVAIILYARTPGTFVDLAADLAWLTARPLSDFILDQHLTVAAGPQPRRTAARGVRHQSGHRRAHRPRLHPATSPLGTRHPRRQQPNRPTHRRTPHPRHDHHRRR